MSSFTHQQQKAIKKATIKRTIKKMEEKFSTQDQMSWEEMPNGSVIPNSGNSEEYITGNWVPKKLIFKEETCIDCKLCWPVCPDDAIVIKDGKMVGVDLDHCKDCGLCVQACPTTPKSLFFEESEAKEI